MGESPPKLSAVRPPKAYKFDSKTKTVLNAMNLHLKEHALVECLHKTQLVNDKKVAKEIMAELPSLATSSSLEERLGSNDPMSNIRATYSGADSHNGEDDRGSQEGRFLHPSLEVDSIAGSQIDPILSIRAGMGELDSRGDATSRFIGETSMSNNLSLQPDLISTMRSNSTDDESQHNRYSCNADAESDEEKKSDCPSGKFMASPSGDSSSNVGLEVTWGQFQSNSGKKQTSPILSSSVKKAASPAWLAVKLKQSTSYSTDKTVVSSSDEQSQPEWANLKLRRVPRSEESAYTASSTSTEQPLVTMSSSTKTDQYLARLSPIPIEIESCSTGATLEEQAVIEISQQSPEVIDIIDCDAEVDDRVEKARTSTDEDVGDDASPAETSLSVPRVGDKIDEATVIKLKDVSGRQDTLISRVIVGSKLIMIAQSVPGNPKSQVSWKLPRFDVESLSLDMASLTVNLILVTGERKCLAFTSSDDCLKFANVFYSMKVTTHGPEPTPNPTTVEHSFDDSVHLESLNDEEHNVLETYRRLRRTKDVREALSESMKVEREIDSMSLTPAQDEIAELYLGLLRKGMSLEAVEQAMRRDGVVNKIFQAVQKAADASKHFQPPPAIAVDELPPSPVSTMSISIGFTLSEAEKKEQLADNICTHDGSDSAPTLSSNDAASTHGSVLTEDEKNTAASYRKMLKLNFPVEIVQHRMKKEGVSERVALAVLGNAAIGVKEIPVVPTSDLTAEEQATADSYRKMLKMGIEKDAVRHKMMKDSVSAKIVAVVLGIPTTSAKQMSTKQDEMTVKSATSGLSHDEETIASSYRKLLKLQIPRDRVLSRMTQDGISEKIIVAVIGRSSITGPSARNNKEDASDSTSASSNKLVALHWTPLSGKELDQSIWKANINCKLDDAEAQPERGDISKLIDLFQKKSNSAKEKLSENSGFDGGKTAKLLELTRSNNIAISLKAFKEFSHKELAETIAFMDPQKKIRGERVQFLKGLLPTALEIKAIRSYVGSDDRLSPAECWFRQIQDIERIEQKVKVIQTMESFTAETELLCESFQLLSTVCNQVMDSEKLQLLLGTVLRIGNIMNEGTRTGRAAGFKMDSLLRLTQTKSSDGKMTVLDFLVEILVEKGQRDSLNLKADFPACHSASRMLIGDLLNETKGMKEALKICQDELDALLTPKGVVAGPSGIGSVAAIAAAVARRKAMEQSGYGAPKPKSEGFAQRDQFLLTIQEKSKDSSAQSSRPVSINACVVEEDKPDNTVEGGIKRLQDFIKGGQEAFNRLDLIRKDAVDACNEMSRYCGESGGTNSTTTLLGILSQFASSLDEALQKYDRRERAKLRRLSQKGDDMSISTVGSASLDSRRTYVEKDDKDNGPSLVLLVNDMLKTANERTIEDFKKGRVIPNPTNHMKAIYEREHHTIHKPEPSFGSPATNRRRLDIVAAIKEHAEAIGKEKEAKARSQFCSKSPLGNTSPQQAVALHKDEKTELRAQKTAQACGVLFASVFRDPASLPETTSQFVAESLSTTEHSPRIQDQSSEHAVADKENTNEIADTENTADKRSSVVECSTSSPIPEPRSQPTMSLNDARKARSLLQKAVDRPQKSDLLPFIPARQLSGNMMSPVSSNHSPVTSSADEHKTTADQVRFPVNDSCLKSSPIRFERRSLGDLAKDRRANKHSNAARSLEFQESPQSERVLRMKSESRVDLQATPVAPLSDGKTSMLELARKKREVRRSWHMDEKKSDE